MTLGVLISGSPIFKWRIFTPDFLASAAYGVSLRTEETGREESLNETFAAITLALYSSIENI